MTLSIDGTALGGSSRTFVIAEIGVNHDGSVQRALELVQHAAEAGADAVKLQIFRADTLMHPSSCFAEYQKQRVSSDNPAEMLRRYELGHRDLQRITDRICKLKLKPLATPFSPDDIDAIEQLGLPAIKIASPDLVNKLLLARAAGTGKPLLISTGAATLDEVGMAAGWLGQWRTEYALLHCVSSYPTPSDETNLKWISELSKFRVPVGYSDHSTEAIAGALAVAAGACIVEKHLTYDRDAPGPDHSASADPEQFAEYIRLIRLAEQMRGQGAKRVLPIERDVRSVSRQSLVLVRDLQAGERIQLSDMTSQRPGTGIPAAEVMLAAGRIARMPLRRGTLLQWGMLSDAA